MTATIWPSSCQTRSKSEAISLRRSGLRLDLPEAGEVAPNIDLLVIGYSGLDVEALNLIKSTKTPVRLMTIVNRSQETAITVRDRFSEFGIKSVWTATANGDFGEWVDAGGLDQLVTQFGGPYPDAY